MRFKQTQDVLDHVGEFHRQASALYRGFMERASNQRVQMLLDYLVRHEQNLGKSVADFKAASSPQVLKSWFEYSHDQDILKPILTADREVDMAFDDVIDLAFGLDEKLLELYQEMVKRAKSPQVKDIFNNLLLREIEEKQKLMRSALGLMDL
jgi:rubrerythrin